MDELVKMFHIDVKMLVAQLVNLAIVFFVLHKFAYVPILKLLNDRTKKIEKGIRDSEDAGKKLAAILEQEKTTLKKAREEAQAIIAKAEDQSRKNKNEIIGETKMQAEKIMADAERKIEEEKNKMIAEVKNEMAELVVMATEKVLSDKIDSNKDKELINNAIKQS